ncbi:unnamed protein product [Urochloa humidicola]
MEFAWCCVQTSFCGALPIGPTWQPRKLTQASLHLPHSCFPDGELGERGPDAAVDLPGVHTPVLPGGAVARPRDGEASGGGLGASEEVGEGGERVGVAAEETQRAGRDGARVAADAALYESEQEVEEPVTDCGSRVEPRREA